MKISLYRIPCSKSTMGKGYSTEEIRQKLILILDGAVSGMSGVEISKEIGVNRITMAKYLQSFCSRRIATTKKYWKCHFMVFRTWNKNLLISLMTILK